MYYITSTNSWYNNLKFESLGEAKEKADDIADRGFNCDVWAVVDNKADRCIYTPEACPAGQAIRDTYVK